ncbi:hypothetical protein BD324DRAFT_157012 [Kockovaella imperatae]|uniref:Uncharacterized protein n=1 Tax=Kockovaella imperatae TaxID=4999 RepID=A0A1Y1UAE8_9TREE|nr:hypothetical protein BD324DRAFT_157012 [Kockovaella imperatae]ORX34524.1 hypothetical protein BD324DRAFT_157012 [Kockovaella imperatae]
MDQLARYIVPHLPADLQALYLHPPNLSEPSSFIPLIRTLFPYAKYLIVVLAFYIVWTTTMSILGYFSRFLRFTMKIGPILALAGWVMANSGQGGVEELVQAAKEWAGLSQPQVGRQWSPGIASLFGASSSTKSRTKKSSSRTGGIFGLGQQEEPISSRTRNGKKRKTRASNEGVGDVLNDLLSSAAGNAAAGGAGGEWQDAVQGYVKRTLAKASGLDWLFGNDQEETGTGRARSR